ncbi:MAG TPA: hypothetical protein VFQ23_20925 [Anaerolineales bacterium]|nr:hypothetical protein [Anaerolineales bacterium]
MKKILLPGFTDFLFIMLFVSALVTGPKMLNIDGDLPRHLLMGKYVLETGSPPTQEIFAYPYEGQSYVSHEWLAGVLFYLSYVLFDLNGVVLLASLLIAGTFTILFSDAVRQNGEIVPNFLLIFFGASVTSIHWIPRPHLFTMLFLAIWLTRIERLDRGNSSKLWMFPALMLLWGNIHAEFVAGFLTLLAYIAGWLWNYLFARQSLNASTGKNLLLVTITSFVATLINPAGLRTWGTILGYINNSYLMSRITETRPPDFARAEYFPLLLLLVISVLLMVTRRDKFTPAHIFLLLGFGTMSLLSARNAHLFGVVAPFVLSNGLKGLSNIQPFKRMESLISGIERQISGRMVPSLLAVVISVPILASAVNFNRFEPAVFPVDAVHWLKENPQPGQVFNAFDWGGYILFHLWPEKKVFIESQTDVRGELTREYEKVITLQYDWQGIFQRYDVSWVIIPPQWDLATELQRIGWEIAYQDPTTIILVAGN